MFGRIGLPPLIMIFPFVMIAWARFQHRDE